MFEEKIVNFHCLLYHVFKLRVMRALLCRNLALYHVTASPGVNVLDFTLAFTVPSTPAGKIIYSAKQTITITPHLF